MTVQDKDFWESYKHGVKQVRSKKSTAPKPHARKIHHKIDHEIPAPPRALHAAKELSLPTLERKREKALKQGAFEIDAKLDLHGLTQDEAFAKLASFMHRQVKAGKRHLLIITGKGRGGEGVLRRSLKDWLSQLPEAKSILALRTASLQHGGDGAFYVVLRKIK